ncbi:MAG: hypothetical protein GQ564_07100 [Bacteroidales bacterium]|nr:hypothetical protein [Bacteroidales bacterium]
MAITTEQIITAISLLGAILAWIAKIRWSKEYKNAKDEIIKSKDSLITQLNESIKFYKDMTPMKIKEYFDSVKLQMEEYNQLLLEQLENAENEIREKENKINDFLKNETEKKVEITKLNTEKKKIKIKVKALEEELHEIKFGEFDLPELSKIDSEQFELLEDSARKLGEQLANFEKKKDIKKLGDKIKENMLSFNWQNRIDAWNEVDRQCCNRESQSMSTAQK